MPRGINLLCVTVVENGEVCGEICIIRLCRSSGFYIYGNLCLCLDNTQITAGTYSFAFVNTLFMVVPSYEKIESSIYYVERTAFIASVSVNYSSFQIQINKSFKMIHRCVNVFC